MSENIPSLEELRESFNRIYNGADRLQQEYDVIREARRLRVPIDIYRRLYYFRKEKYIQPYPKSSHWLQAPNNWAKWFSSIPKRKKFSLIRKGIFWLIKQGAIVTTVLALSQYFFEAPFINFLMIFNS